MGNRGKKGNNHLLQICRGAGIGTAGIRCALRDWANPARAGPQSTRACQARRPVTRAICPAPVLPATEKHSGFIVVARPAFRRAAADDQFTMHIVPAILGIGLCHSSNPQRAARDLELRNGCGSAPPQKIIIRITKRAAQMRDAATAPPQASFSANLPKKTPRTLAKLVAVSAR